MMTNSKTFRSPNETKKLDLVEYVGKCIDCGPKLTMSPNVELKKGMSMNLTIKCKHCGWSHQTYTSNKLKREGKSRGVLQFEINSRIVIAFQEIGKGFSSIETFCGVMNMLPPMSKTTYSDKLSAVHDAYLTSSHASMSDASLEVRKQLQGELFDATSISDIDAS